ncbi:hypothetical protein XELAEV_18041980mg [Xenopus laevis]|uniref:DUF4371 domain-containing protein n=1 Tax=Xenopus laevis TaxID=8355 RepID=A0A974C378_XENLA|nr:hypothetical protein XELAEV_18041980mg [Xenopus laevis]
MSAVTNGTLMEEHRSCSLSSINASEDFLSEAFESHAGLSVVNWKDPALWPDTLRGKPREYIVLAGLMSEQDLLKTVQSLPKDYDGQAFSEFHLYSKSPNGREMILRDWLRWNDSKKVLYCTTCLAFSTDSANKTGSSLCRNQGFDPLKSKWHQLYKKLPEHEHSAQHRKNYWSWQCLQKSVGGQGVDHDIQGTLAVEAEKFTVLLERLLDVLNLAFRGSSQRVGDIQNGNFLGILELMAHYDAVLKEHLDKVKRNQEKGEKLPAHYLSWGTRINSSICVDAMQEAIYFTVICDASPDISHTEQNVIVLCYVHRCSQTGKWCIQERFLEFFDCDTRWRSRVEAIRPVAKKLPSILQALEKIISSRRLTRDAQSEAVGLYNYFSSFCAILLATFWLKVLQCFDEQNSAGMLKKLTNEDLEASTKLLVAKYHQDLTDSLLDELQHLRKGLQ